MSDVNWKKYDCSICLMVGLIGAAVVAGIVARLMMGAGLSPVWLALLTIIVAAILFWLVDGYCAGREASVGAPSVAAGISGQAMQTETRDDGATQAAAVKAAEEAAVAEAAAARAKAAEAAAAQAKAAEEAATAEAKASETDGEGRDYDGDGVVEGTDEGTRPAALDGPRGGTADDLKRIKGVGPKLEKVCNSLGFYHFDQIAAWTADEIAWVDANLEGFRGRVTRDAWVDQAKTLATGGDTEFSKRVDDGDVPSSQ